MDRLQPSVVPIATTRRAALTSCAMSLSGLALRGMLHAESVSQPRTSFDMKPRVPHNRPRARAVIQLFQNGGPSQMDMFDNKPELSRRNGQPHPGDVETFQLGNRNVLMGTAFEFSHHGECGMEFSELIPHLSGVADDLCLVRSMYTCLLYTSPSPRDAALSRMAASA